MDNQRLILLLVFLFSLFMLWDGWQKQNQPAVAGKTQAPQACRRSRRDRPAPATSCLRQPAAPPPSAVPQWLRSRRPPVQRLGQDGSLPCRDFIGGGDLVRLELTQHKATEDKSQHFVLMEISKDRTYLAQTGLIGEGLPNHKTEFRLDPGSHELKPDSDKLEIRLEAPEANGLKVVKIYTFHRGSYQIDVGYEIANQRQTPLAAHAYYQLTRDGKVPEASMTNIATFTGPAIYTDEGKFQKIDLPRSKRARPNLCRRPRMAGWPWCSIISSPAGHPRASDEREFFVRKVADNLFSAGIILPVPAVAPGQTIRVGVPLYAGPAGAGQAGEGRAGFRSGGGLWLADGDCRADLLAA
jgi:YidC/Oxa1 family membrane protein insertase